MVRRECVVAWSIDCVHTMTRKDIKKPAHAERLRDRREGGSEKDADDPGFAKRDLHSPGASDANPGWGLMNTTREECREAGGFDVGDGKCAALGDCDHAFAQKDDIARLKMRKKIAFRNLDQGI